MSRKISSAQTAKTPAQADQLLHPALALGDLGKHDAPPEVAHKHADKLDKDQDALAAEDQPAAEQTDAAAQNDAPIQLAAAETTASDAPPVAAGSVAAESTPEVILPSVASGGFSSGLLILSSVAAIAVVAGGGGKSSSTSTSDTTAPAVPVIGAVTGNDLVNAAEKTGGITLAGTAEANATVVVTWGTTVKSTTASTLGLWTATFSAGEIPADGSSTVSATAADAAGNVSVAGTRPVTIDTVAPTAPTFTTVAGNDVVNAAEKGAGVAVSGTAEANASVAVTWGATTKTVAADAAGTWSASFAAGEVPADGNTTISATASDAAGNASTAGTHAVAIDATIATPTLVLTNDTGADAGDKITSDATLTFSNPAADVSRTYNVDNTGASAAYTKPAGDGSHTVVVTDTDSAGNTASASLTFTLDKTIATPTVALANDTGVAGDHISADATLNVSPTPVANDVTRSYNLDSAGASASYTAPTTDGAHSVVVTDTDTAGNMASATLNFTLDTTAPEIQLLSANGAAQQVVLTYNDTLDAGNPPVPGAFAVTTGGVANAVAGVAISGNQVTLTLTDAFTTGASVTVGYTDPSVGNDVAAIQDLAGNDAASFATGVVADGYVRGATVYIDTNGNGTADPGVDFLVGTTDANGNFFLPAGAPVGAIIAVGGVNIDTGVPNSVPFKAPAGSTSINPLTTLVQALVDQGKSVAEAQSNVVDALGLPPGTDLSSYDPIGALQANPADANALATQKAAASVAFLLDLVNASPNGGSGAAASAAALVNLANTVSAAAAGSTTVDLADSVTIATLLDNGSGGSLTTPQATSDLQDANTAIAGATLLTQISTAQSQYLDHISPYEPGTPDLLASSDSGVLNNDNVTNAATPTLRVSFDVTNLNGHAAVAGDHLQLAYDDGATPLEITHTLTAAEIAQGYADISVADLADGAHLFSAQLTDQAGNASGASATLVTVIDRAAPDAPSIALAHDTGAQAIDGISNDGTVSVSGLEASATWQFSSDGGTNWTDGVGSSFTLAAGDYDAGMVQARQIDRAGNIGDAATLDILHIDQSAPVAPSLALAIDTGANTADGISSNGIVVLSGLEVGAAWQYSLDSGANWQAGAGNSLTLAAGDYPAGTVMARQIDQAGNVSTSGSAGHLTIDTSAPAVPGLALAHDTGTSAADGISSNGTINVSGLEAGATWEFSSDAGAHWSAGSGSSFTLVEGSYATGDVLARQTDAAGNLGGTATLGDTTFDATAPTATATITGAFDNVDPNQGNVTSGGAGNDNSLGLSGSISAALDAGNQVAIYDGAVRLGAADVSGTTWSFATIGLTNAGHSFTAQVEDAAGNAGTASAAYTVTVAANTPASIAVITGATDDVAANLGNIASGGLSNDARPALAGNLSIALAAGETVMVYDGATALGAATVTGTTWTFTPGADLAQGAHSFTALVQNAGGNQGALSTAYNFTLDTSAPATPTLALAADTGASNSDGYTGNAAVNVSGLEAGATWEYSTNSGTTWNAGSGTSFTLGAGVHPAGIVMARQTDAAGNLGSAASLAGTVTIDTSAGAPFLTLHSDTGSSNSDGISQIGTVDVAGLEAGATWQFSSDGGTTWQNGSGESFTLAVGAYAAGKVVVRQTDLAGNTSAAGNLGAVTIDTTAPSLSALILDPASDSGLFGDGKSNNTTPTLDFTAEARASISINTGAGFVAAGTATGAAQSFAVPVALTTDGDYTLTVRATDAAGNSTTQSLAYHLDTTPPSLSVTAMGDANKTSAEATAGGGVVHFTADPGSLVSLLFIGSSGSVAKTFIASGLEQTVKLTAGNLNTLGQGDVTVHTSATDSNGNSSAVNTTGGFNLDTLAPTSPAFALAHDTGASGDLVSSDGTVSVTGLEAGGTWQFSTDSGANWSNGSGSSFTLSEGSHAAGSVRVRQSDVAGNLSATQSNAGAIVIDSTAPAETVTISGADDNVPAVPVVNITAGSTTNDNTPTLKGTVSAALGANESLVIYDGATLGATRLGAATVSGTDWSYTPAGLANGDHSFTARVEDLAGNTGAASATYGFSIDATVPTATASISGAGDNVALHVGNITNGGLSNDATLDLSGAITGTLNAGDVVRVYDNASLIGSASVSGATWSFTTPALGEGKNDFTALVENAGGNQGAASATYTVNLDLTPPAVPTIATVSGDDLVSAAEKAAGVTVSGTAEASSSVTVTWGATTHSVTANGAGAWSSNFAAGEIPADGAGNITATATDAAGNTGGTASHAVTIDTVAPSLTPFTLAAGSDSGTVGDGISNVTTPTIQFTAEAGSVLSINFGNGAGFQAAGSATGGLQNLTAPAGAFPADGAYSVQLRATDAAGNSSTQSAVYTLDSHAPAAPSAPMLAPGSDSGIVGDTDALFDNLTKVTTPTVTGTAEAGSTLTLKEGATVLGSTTVAGDGTWSVTSSTLAPGAHTLSATATDAAGNTSAASTQVVTIDTTAPVASSTTLDAGSDSGTAGDNLTNVITPVITGVTEAGAHINLMEQTSPGNFLIQGSTTAAADGSWSITTGELANGAHTLSAQAMDKAGNPSLSANLVVTIDATAPSLTPFTLAAGSDSGTIGDFISNIATPTIAFTAEAGSSLAIDLGDGSGFHTVDTGTGAAQTMTVPAYTADGTYHAQLRATDAAGNSSTQSHDYTLDSHAPNAPTGLTLAPASDTGTQGDGITGDTTPTITGSAEAGATVTLKEGATVLGNTTAAGDGAWSITSSALANGAHSLTATASDTAGNVSGNATNLALTIDDSMPASPADLALAAASDSGALGDGITNVTAPTVTGTAQAGLTVTLREGATVLGSTTADGSGHWSIAVAALAEGAHSLTATATNLSAATSDPSTAFALTIDTAAPALTLPTLAAGSDSGTSGDGISNVATPTIQFTAEAGSSLAIDLGDGTGFHAAGSGTGAAQPLTAPGYATDGTYHVQLRATDTAGNSTTQAFDYTLDRIAPSLTPFTLAAGSDSGLVGDGISNVATPTIPFTADAGSSLSIDFGNGTGFHAAGLATGGSQSLTAPAGAFPADGGYFVQLRATDAAGNSTTQSAVYTLDTHAPDAPTQALASDTGASTIDGITSNGQVNVSGLEAGAAWEYSTNSGASWNAGTGSSFTLSAGTHAAGSIQVVQADLAGNGSGTGSNAAAITVDSTAPVFQSAAVNGASLTLTYGETLDAAHVAATGAFTVLVNGIARGVSSAAASGSVVSLTLASVVANGDTVTIAYSDPTANDDANATQDVAGNDAASFAATAVTNNTAPGVDVTSPSLSSASVDGTVITLAYSEALDAAHQPSASYYSVSVGGQNRAVETVAIIGSNVYLTLHAGVSAGDGVTLSYNDPSAGNDVYAIQDVTGNDAASLAGQGVNNVTVGTATTTNVVQATFTETANADVTFLFNEAMQASNANGVTILKNGTGANILTGASVSGETVTFHTSATLAAGDFVEVIYSGGSDLRDTSNNYVGHNTMIIGGSGANTIDLSTFTNLVGEVRVRSNGGADILTGSGNADNLNPGGGSDTVNGGWNADSINLSESIRASDTVVTSTDGGSSSGSQVYFYDTVYAFDVSSATVGAGSTNDKLNFPSNTIAADVSHADGTDVGALAKHSIAGGILTFEDASGNAILINASNLNDATAYLEANFTSVGQALAFEADTNGTVHADSLFVFQNQGGSDLDNDVLIKLAGVTGVTLGTTAGQNVVQLVDNSGPFTQGGGAGTGANATFTLSSNETLLATAGHQADGLTLLKDGIGANVVTGGLVSGADLIVQTNASLTDTDYLFIRYDGAAGTIHDASGNAAADMLPGVALSGSGGSTIDLNTIGTDDYGAYGLGGNDTLIGNAGNNDMGGGDGNDSLSGGAGNDQLEGGTGADTMDGGSGADEYTFTQGDSTPVSFNQGTGVYTFTGGADVITGGFDTVATNGNSQSGDYIHLRSAMPGNGLTQMGAVPANGLVGDQGYYLVQGDYNAGAGTFTDNAGGADTLVVYDGNSATGAVSQTALVAAGVTPDQFGTWGGDIYLTSLPTPVSAAVGSYALVGYAYQNDPAESQAGTGTLTLYANGTYTSSLSVNSNLDSIVHTADLSGTYVYSADGSLAMTSTQWGDTTHGYIGANGVLVSAMTSTNSTSEEIYVGSRLGGTFSMAGVAGTYGIIGYANQDAPAESQSGSGTLTLNANGTYSESLSINSNLDSVVHSANLTGTYTLAADGSLTMTSNQSGDTTNGHITSNGMLISALTAASSTSEEIYVGSRLGSGFTMAQVAGTYGLAGYANQDAPAESQSGAGMLTLNADGTYTGSLSVDSNFDNLIHAANLGGTYTLGADGALAMTSTQWGDTSYGYITANGTILSAMTSANSTSEEIYVGSRLNVDYTAVVGGPASGQPYVYDAREQLQDDVAYPANGTMQFQVNMSQNVTVTGAPTLQLVIGDAANHHTVLATYDAALSTSNSLVFDYTPQAGDVGQLAVGNLYLPSGASIQDASRHVGAFLGITNTGNVQAVDYVYGTPIASGNPGTVGNDWVTAGSTASNDWSQVVNADAGNGGNRDILVINIRDSGTGTITGGPVAGGMEGSVGGRDIQILRDGNGVVNLYEVIGGTQTFIRTLSDPSQQNGFERLMINLVDGSGNVLDGTGAMTMVSGTFTDSIRNDQLTKGSEFGDTLTVPANPSAYQIIWSGDGNDTITGSNNGDSIDISGGNDLVLAGGGNDALFWNGQGHSLVDGGSGNDTITLSGNDWVNHLGGAITTQLQVDGKLHVLIGGVDTAQITQGSAGDSWDYQISTSSNGTTPGDMRVDLIGVENFQIHGQNTTQSLTLSTLFPAPNATPPTNTGASFSEGTNASISLNYSEPVIFNNSNGVSIDLNPNLNDGHGGRANPAFIAPTSGSGYGTNTITFTTATTLASTDVLRITYHSAQGSVTDVDGNPLGSGEIWVGGSGGNYINLSDYGSDLSIALRGNGGADTLIGTYANDLLVDGGGADTLIGGGGADIFRLVENGTDKVYARDVIKIELGDSPATGAASNNAVGIDFDIVLGASASPTGTGFDITSVNSANHDVLDLTSKLIAANTAGYVAGSTNSETGVITQMSITAGIASFENASNQAVQINEKSNAYNALRYLMANDTNHGTVAFKLDMDGNGTNESLLVFQDTGHSNLLGSDLPDTAVILGNLAGIDTATLGTTAGDHVVQIQDTQVPDPVGFALTTDGFAFDFAENVNASTSLNLTMLKNGTNATTISSVDGSGTSELTIHGAGLSLAANDWLLIDYNGSNATNGFSDASGNVWSEGTGQQSAGWAEGSAGNNVIDLSGRSVANPTTDGYDLEGFAGNDTLIGSSADDWLNGGTGADALTGGAGSDSFSFEQGDSPTAVFHDNGGAGVNSGDTFSFANGVDVITDLASGERVELNNTQLSNLFGHASQIHDLGAVPSDGLVTDQGYYLVQGNYNAGSFTVDTSATGHDTLVVWDGSSGSAVSQTGIVLAGIQLADLSTGGDSIQLNAPAGETWLSGGDDTIALPTPGGGSQTIDGLGGTDTLSFASFPNEITSSPNGLHFGTVLDPNFISSGDEVFDMVHNPDGSVHLGGFHFASPGVPQADYDLTLKNFEQVHFDDGQGSTLTVNSATDIGVVHADQATAGTLDGNTLAGNYRFASYEVDSTVHNVIGGAAIADTAVLQSGTTDALSMVKDTSNASMTVWRISDVNTSQELFDITSDGYNGYNIDYTSNGVGTDVNLSGVEYALLTNTLGDPAMRLNLQVEPTVIV
jgi:uncharacterized repeat protein (TIGR02059 family)